MAIEVGEHRGAVDLEACDDLEHGGAGLVGSDQFGNSSGFKRRRPLLAHCTKGLGEAGRSLSLGGVP